MYPNYYHLTLLHLGKGSVSTAKTSGPKALCRMKESQILIVESIDRPPKFFVSIPLEGMKNCESSGGFSRQIKGAEVVNLSRNCGFLFKIACTWPLVHNFCRECADSMDKDKPIPLLHVESRFSKPLTSGTLLWCTE